MKSNNVFLEYMITDTKQRKRKNSPKIHDFHFQSVKYELDT